MSSRFVRLAIIAALLVVLAHAVEAKLGESACVMENDHQQEEERTQDYTTDESDWPSLRLDFTIKSESMQVFGQPNFTVLANPFTAFSTPEVIYDAFTTFTEGSATHNYTLVDGTAYLSSGTADNSTAPTVKCLSSDASEVLLMVNSIAQMINDAKPSSAEEKAGIDCASGNLFTVALAGTDFSVCALASSGFTMFGKDMDVTVAFLEDRVNIQTPAVDSGEESGCAKLVSATPVTSTGRAILTRHH